MFLLLEESKDFCFSGSPPSSQSGYEHSPYPEIDNFISQVINKGGVQGEIRRWVFFPQGIYHLSQLTIQTLPRKDIKLNLILPTRGAVTRIHQVFLFGGHVIGVALNIRDLAQNTTATRTPQTKGLMSRAIAVHVRYKSVYISLPSSAKQQRELTKFCVV